ncbi:MAG: 30S ribosomal protein S6 [Patescibacteria group bacterium]
MSDETMQDGEAVEMGLFEADTDKGTDPQVYEIGYHLLPTLSGDEAQAATKDLMNFLKKQGAEAVGDKAPEQVDLAYAIQKRIAGKLTKFRSAHFGWVAFEVLPSTLTTIKSFMDTNPSVLRFLIVSTTAEEVKAFLEGAVIMPRAPEPTGTIGPSKRASEEGAVVTEEGLSKALETLEKEDAKVE